MGFFGKVKDGLKKASDNAKQEEDLDEGVSIDGVVTVISELNKRRKASKRSTHGTSLARAESRSCQPAGKARLLDQFPDASNTLITWLSA